MATGGFASVARKHREMSPMFCLRSGSPDHSPGDKGLYLSLYIVCHQSLFSSIFKPELAFLRFLGSPCLPTSTASASVCGHRA